MAFLKNIISNTVHQILVLHLSLSYYQNPTVLKLKTQKLSILNMKKHYFHSIGYIHNIYTFVTFCFRFITGHDFIFETETHISTDKTTLKHNTKLFICLLLTQWNYLTTRSATTQPKSPITKMVNIQIKVEI